MYKCGFYVHQKVIRIFTPALERLEDELYKKADGKSAEKKTRDGKEADEGKDKDNGG